MRMSIGRFAARFFSLPEPRWDVPKTAVSAFFLHGCGKPGQRVQPRPYAPHAAPVAPASIKLCTMQHCKHNTRCCMCVASMPGFLQLRNSQVVYNK